MRVLLVIPELVPGGAERIVVGLAADAVAAGDEVVVATAGGSWEGRVEEVGAVVAHVPLRARSARQLPQAAWALRDVVRRFRPAVVHAHNVRAGVAAAGAMALAGRSRAPVLTTVHGLAPDDYVGAARLLRLSRQRVVACAPAVAAALTRAGLPPARVTTITNGAGLDAADAARIEVVRARLGIGEAPLVVGIGRLVPQKAWHVLVEASRSLSGADVVVLGDGPLRHELDDLARGRGAPVRFVGAVDDVAAVLGAATCLVSTSTWEGLPLSLLEALSLGVPAVATAVDGVIDIVPPDAAVLVPPHDPRAVADGLRGLLADPVAARALGARAKAASAAWSPAAMYAGYRRAYEELLSGR